MAIMFPPTLISGSLSMKMTTTDETTGKTVNKTSTISGIKRGVMSTEADLQKAYNIGALSAACLLYPVSAIYVQEKVQVEAE